MTRVAEMVLTGLAPFAAGDIFVTASQLDESARFPTGHGAILQIAADWTPKAALETGHFGLIASLTLDLAGNLHALDPQARAITSIGPDGKPKTMFGKLPQRGYGSMIVLDDGDFLLGEHMIGETPGFAGRGKVYRVKSDGAVIDEYDTETNGGVGGFLGVTHMALSRDGKTLFHTSETGPHVYAHDLLTNKRLGPIYTRADPPPMVFGLECLGDESILVAGGNGIRRISGGAVVQNYDLPNGRGWAVAKARPDGRAWVLDFFGGRLACLDTESGTVSDVRELGLAKCLCGIAEMKSES
jgi:hypothetical protein